MVVLISVIIVLIEFSILYLYLNQIFTRQKPKNKWKYLTFLLIPIFLAGHLLFTENATSRLAFLYISVVVICRFVYEEKLQKSIFIAGIWLITISVCEFMTLGMLLWIKGTDDLYFFSTDITMYLLGVLISKTLAFYLLMYFAKKIKNKKYAYQKIEIAIFMLQGITSLLSMIILFNILMYSREFFGFHTLFLVLIGVFFVASYIIIFELMNRYMVFIKNDKKLQAIQQNMKAKEKYYEGLEAAKKEINELYHDMKNHLLAIQGLEQINKSKSSVYVEEMLDRLEGMKKYSNTGNAMIDIILQEKRKLAMQLGIHMEAVIEKDCLNMYDNTYLCAIFSNALDNALEANVGNEEASINIKAFKDMNQVIIYIKNTYEHIVKQDTEGNYTTTKEDKKHHGFGLSSMREAVKYFAGEIQINNDNNIFSILIMLPER